MLLEKQYIFIKNLIIKLEQSKMSESEDDPREE